MLIDFPYHFNLFVIILMFILLVGQGEVFTLGSEQMLFIRIFTNQTINGLMKKLIS